jgi:glycosyltransferase involved in cell wall biosynthesis
LALDWGADDALVSELPLTAAGLPMQRLDSNSRMEPAGAILACSCVRDESLRLPWFLDYYRKAGVDRFLIVDNGSRDGTTELLLSQRDVILYYTEESYAASNYGLSWLNTLLARHAVDRWALTVDADELLVYPASEQVTLPKLVQYLEAQGADSLRTLLLDMYSRSPIDQTAYRQGDSFLSSCPYFDVETYRRRWKGVPTRGGPRGRVFWGGRGLLNRWLQPEPFLQKLPLVRWRSGLSYELSTHRISGIRPAALTGVLLHFKFFQDFPARAAKEAERKEHFREGRQYQTYHETLVDRPDLSLHHDRSVAYRNSLQLVELGLQRMPRSYRELAAVEARGSS